MFVPILIEWYEENKRDLIFRHTNDPYKIWISEIMLQQTTIQAVIPYYERFIKTYPDIKTLSNAKLEDIYKIWEGLGYYRRAKHLYETSQFIMTYYNGLFPDNYKDILSLKGIGPYTASAICSFAYHQSYSAIDANALRVLARIWGIKDNIASTKTIRMITEKSNKLIQGYDSSSYNQGLMDLAHAYCFVKNPDCMHCPLYSYCIANLDNSVNFLPVKIKKVKKTEKSYITGIIQYKNKYVLLKNKEGLLENMYGLIQYEVDSPYSFIENFYNDYHISISIINEYESFKHVFTHQTWFMNVYIFSISEDFSSYTKKEIELLPISTAHRKILDHYFSSGIHHTS